MNKEPSHVVIGYHINNRTNNADQHNLLLSFNYGVQVIQEILIVKMKKPTKTKKMYMYVRRNIESTVIILHLSNLQGKKAQDIYFPYNKWYTMYIHPIILVK